MVVKILRQALILRKREMPVSFVSKLNFLSIWFLKIIPRPFSSAVCVHHFLSSRKRNFYFYVVGGNTLPIAIGWHLINIEYSQKPQVRHQCPYFFDNNSSADKTFELTFQPLSSYDILLYCYLLLMPVVIHSCLSFLFRISISYSFANRK